MIESLLTIIAQNSARICSEMLSNRSPGMCVLLSFLSDFLPHSIGMNASNAGSHVANTYIIIIRLGLLRRKVHTLEDLRFTIFCTLSRLHKFRSERMISAHVTDKRAFICSPMISARLTFLIVNLISWIG
jgi:hypothetical protein